jgi:arsenate reductase
MNHVPFLCTGNSCRSPMAEGLVNHFLAGEWTAYSAGTEPADYVHPLAVQAMAELGIDISHQYSKNAGMYHHTNLDLVVTVCDDAAKNCPIWLGAGLTQHLGFQDPARVVGSQEQQWAVFRHVREEMRKLLFALLIGDWALSPASFHQNSTISASFH